MLTAGLRFGEDVEDSQVPEEYQDGDQAHLKHIEHNTEQNISPNRLV